MFQPNIRLANFLLAEYPDEYPAGWYLVNFSLEIKCGKVLFFRALTFVWELCTLLPCLLHVLGGSSFLSVQIRSSLTALVIVRS